MCFAVVVVWGRPHQTAHYKLLAFDEEEDNFNN